MKVTALLTGRGNNTLPDKNVREILGHPVLHYVRRYWTGTFWCGMPFISRLFNPKELPAGLITILPKVFISGEPLLVSSSI